MWCVVTCCSVASADNILQEQSSNGDRAGTPEHALYTATCDESRPVRVSSRQSPGAAIWMPRSTDVPSRASTNQGNLTVPRDPFKIPVHHGDGARAGAQSPTTVCTGEARTCLYFLCFGHCKNVRCSYKHDAQLPVATAQPEAVAPKLGAVYMAYDEAH
jgi:hypothetical protein